MYSVYNLQTKRRTCVYELPSADFTALFHVLLEFRNANALEDCYIGSREYSPDEIREDGRSRAVSEEMSVSEESEDDGIEASKKPSTKRLAAAKKRQKPPKPESGMTFVLSFDIKVRGLDDAKAIDYEFYEDGWPGSVRISKTGRAAVPTEIVLEYTDRGRDLAASLEALLDDVNISSDARAIGCN